MSNDAAFSVSVIVYLILCLGGLFVIAWVVVWKVAIKKSASFDEEKLKWTSSLEDPSFVKTWGVFFTSYYGTRGRYMFNLLWVIFLNVQAYVLAFLSGLAQSVAFATGLGVMGIAYLIWKPIAEPIYVNCKCCQKKQRKEVDIAKGSDHNDSAKSDAETKKCKIDSNALEASFLLMEALSVGLSAWPIGENCEPVPLPVNVSIIILTTIVGMIPFLLLVVSFVEMLVKMLKNCKVRDKIKSPARKSQIVPIDGRSEDGTKERDVSEGPASKKAAIDVPPQRTSSKRKKRIKKPKLRKPGGMVSRERRRLGPLKRVGTARSVSKLHEQNFEVCVKQLVTL